MKNAAPDRLAIQVAEPSLNQVQPLGTCGDEVKYEACVALQPIPHVLLLASAGDYDVERNLARELLVQ